MRIFRSIFLFVYNFGYLRPNKRIKGKILSNRILFSILYIHPTKIILVFMANKNHEVSTPIVCKY